MECPNRWFKNRKEAIFLPKTLKCAKAATKGEERHFNVSKIPQRHIFVFTQAEIKTYFTTYCQGLCLFWCIVQITRPSGRWRMRLLMLWSTAKLLLNSPSSPILIYTRPQSLERYNDWLELNSKTEYNTCQGQMKRSTEMKPTLH